MDCAMIGKIIGGVGLVLAMYGAFMLARSTPSGYSMPFWGDAGTVASLQQTNDKLKRGQQRAMWCIFAGFAFQLVSLFF